MNIKRLLSDFVTVFSVCLTVAGIVTLLGNLVVHGASTIDWEASFRFAAVFGIIFSLIETRRSKAVCGRYDTCEQRGIEGQSRHQQSRQPDAE